MNHVYNVTSGAIADWVFSFAVFYVLVVIMVGFALLSFVFLLGHLGLGHGR